MTGRIALPVTIYEVFFRPLGRSQDNSVGMCCTSLFFFVFFAF